MKQVFMLLQAQEEALTLPAAPCPGMVQPATARAALNTYFYLVMQEAKGLGEAGGRGEGVYTIPGKDEMLPQSRLLTLH